MTPTAMLSLLALVLVLLVLGIASYDRGRTQQVVARRRTLLSMRRERISPWRRAAQATVLRVPFGRGVDERLRRAGIEGVLAGDAVLAALAAAGIVLLLSVQLLAAVAAIILAVVTLVAADRYLDRRVRRRAEQFADQLADIARLLSNAASAGMAIPNALSLTAREMEEPAHSLLSQAVRRMDVGQTLAGAMDELQEQAPSREMAVLVSTLVIQQRSGGDVIEALREMSFNLEARRDLKREVDTTMAGVRFTAYAVMGLGVGTLLLLEALSSGTLRRMTDRPVGQLVLVVAFGLYGAGFLAMRRLSRVCL
ncbi:MAG TPA: type II secretion system F family protein [Euzebya sp.]|nr:type II secretion system F family protein [Euzebya sp.]